MRKLYFEQIINLNVLQDFMNTLGDVTSVEEKFRKINDILIEKYNIKYSTIVVYNGTEYVIKASNVAEKHWDTLKNLHTEEIFKVSQCLESTFVAFITYSAPLYITIVEYFISYLSIRISFILLIFSSTDFSCDIVSIKSCRIFKLTIF